jgi:hypothetical protein
MAALPLALTIDRICNGLTRQLLAICFDLITAALAFFVLKHLRARYLAKHAL